MAGSALLAVHPLYTYRSPLHVTPAIACPSVHAFVFNSAPITQESRTYTFPLYLIVLLCSLGLCPSSLPILGGWNLHCP
ncbi:hypothetical protein ATCV1_z400R [Acanthocystis turfacea chlorella virus 1]|uniref:Uncharacterized protein z400R n=1 Tax=Chlorovirus heliozoae TaxID=322019 RepID=A7K910_9PHYC|nr:hypothetical protein ATCV1_z400R [Acanthocystis turfacea chlorella virus 1]ABT16534.1 hypothetical protein ATCV1_z400R [Acanthocystis turfacea chlorella virus 1]